MKLKVNAWDYTSEENNRYYLPSDLFNEVYETIKQFVQSHKKSTNNYRNPNTSTGPVIGQSLRLHNLENGIIEQFNVHYWNRARNSGLFHKMKTMGGITFYYKKATNTEAEEKGEVDSYELFKELVITHSHQGPKPIFNGSINQWMFSQPDLTEEKAKELLNQIKKIMAEEENKGNIVSIE